MRRLVVLKFSEGQWGRIFCSALDTASFSWRKTKQTKKKPGALQNARFPVLILSRGRFLNAQFCRSRSARGAGAAEPGWALLWEFPLHGEVRAGIASPPSSPLTLGLLLSGFVQPQNSVLEPTLPIPSDSILPLFELGVGEEPTPNAFELLVCDFQW